MATTSMSSEELRAHLYRCLQGKGILDSLKSQLRNRLATELQMSMEDSPLKPTVSDGPPPPLSTTGSPSHHPITVQVANSIVAEHLRKSGYDYSLSIFLPEGGISLDKILSLDDLLHYLRLAPSSPLYQALKSSNNGSGFLVQLLDALVDHTHSPAVLETQRSAAAVQTEAADHSQQEANHKPSVAEQLQALDQSYAEKAKEETEKVHRTLHERVESIQTELEARYKKQLESELSLYRTRELAKVRLEERERYLEELARERTQLNLDYQRKVEELRRNEQHTVERYRQKEQELESSLYSQRQALLSELEALRQKEGERKRQGELSKRAVEIEEQRVRAMAEQLESQRRSLQQVAEEKAQRYRQEIESSIQSRQSELQRREAELQSASSLQSANERLAAELREEREKNVQLQGVLHEVTNKQISAERTKDSLMRQLKEMADYQAVKQRSVELQRQLAVVNKKLTEVKVEYRQRSSEQQRLIKQLQSKLSRPSSELLALQLEVDQLQKTHLEEMAVLEGESRELRKQVSIQTEYSGELQRQVDSQMLQLRMALREVEDLRQVLEHVGPPALQGTTTGVSERRMKAESRRHTSKKPSVKSHQPPHNHPMALTAATYRPPPLTAVHHDTPPSNANTHTVSFSDASAVFLAETRQTFARLEREAEELEKTYQNVNHHHQTSSTAGLVFEGALPKLQYSLASHTAAGLDSQILQSPSIVSSVPSYLSVNNSPSNRENETPHSKTTPPLLPTGTGLDPLVDTLSEDALVLYRPLSLPVTRAHPASLIPLTTTHPPLMGDTVSQRHTPLLSLPTTHPPQPANSTHHQSCSDDGFTADSHKDNNHSSSSSCPPEVQPPHEPAPQVSVLTSVGTGADIQPPSLETDPTVAVSQVEQREGPHTISLDDWWKPSPTHQPVIETTHTNTVTAASLHSAPLVDKSREITLRSDPQLVSERRGGVEGQPVVASPPQRSHTSPPAEIGSEQLTPVSGGTTPHRVPLPSSKDQAGTAPDSGQQEAQGSAVVQQQEDGGTTQYSEAKGGTESSHKNDHDDGIDPVILKYMQLVTQKREKEKQEHHQSETKREVAENMTSPQSRDIDVPSLSQASESFGGFSDNGDPFEDW